MTVPNLQLQTEHAGLALTQKLTDHGLKVVAQTSDNHSIQISWEVNQQLLLADVLTTYIFVDWCYEYIHHRVGVLHDYLTDDEREYIALLTYHSLRKADDPIAGRTPAEWRDILLGAITEVMADGSAHSINIDGLVRFRLKEYLAVIDPGIQEIVEQFFADREYEEFVSMLRYMLDQRPPSSQVLHVFCSNERVWICDETGNLVRDSMVSAAARQVTEGGEVNAEDLAMSILITRAPCHIVIHDLSVDAPWPSFAETVEKVFIGRASRCSDCSTCGQLQQSRETQVSRDVPRHAIPDKYE